MGDAAQTTLTELVNEGKVRFSDGDNVKSLYAETMHGRLHAIGPVACVWRRDEGCIALAPTGGTTVADMMRSLDPSIGIDCSLYVQLRLYEREYPRALPKDPVLWLANCYRVTLIIMQRGAFYMEPADLTDADRRATAYMSNKGQWLIESDVGKDMYEGLTETGIRHFTLREWATYLHRGVAKWAHSQKKATSDTIEFARMQIQCMLNTEKFDLWKFGGVLFRDDQDVRPDSEYAFTTDTVNASLPVNVQRGTFVSDVFDDNCNIHIDHIFSGAHSSPYGRAVDNLIGCEVVARCAEPIVMHDRHFGMACMYRLSCGELYEYNDWPRYDRVQPPKIMSDPKQRPRVIAGKHHTLQAVKTPRGMHGGWTKSGRHTKGFK